MTCEYVATGFIAGCEAIVCLLKKGHSGDHLSRLPSGTYILWAVRDCACIEQGLAVEGHRCTEHAIISSGYAESLLEGGHSG